MVVWRTVWHAPGSTYLGVFFLVFNYVVMRLSERATHQVVSGCQLRDTLTLQSAILKTQSAAAVCGARSMHADHRTVLDMYMSVNILEYGLVRWRCCAKYNMLSTASGKATK